MEKANVLVALYGGRDTTVPKYDVTPAEVAVLRAIHGDDAVHDVEPTGDVLDEDGRAPRNRDELARVKEKYAGANTSPLIERLFPGSAARVPETFDELDLPEELYKPLARAKPQKAADRPDPDEPDRKSQRPRKPAKGEQGTASANEEADAEKAGLFTVKEDRADDLLG